MEVKQVDMKMLQFFKIKNSTDYWTFDCGTSECLEYLALADGVATTI